MIEFDNRQFELIKNYRDAFDKEEFKRKYIETFDKYDVIVGDVSSNILRLKGFTLKPSKSNHVSTIPDYLNESCNYNTPYFIVKRVRK